MPNANSVLSPELRPISLAVFAMIAVVAFESVSIVAALPAIVADLGDVSLLPWVVTAYLIAAAIAIVAAGPLVDAWGVRRIFRWAVLAFALISGAAAAAPSMIALVGLRVAHGAAGGVVIAVALAAVSLAYPRRLVGRAFASNSIVWGVIGIIGPGLTATLLAFGSWRGVFLAAVPVSAFSLILGWKTLPSISEPRPVRLDLTGLVLLAIFSISLVLAVDRLDRWSAGLAVLALIGAAALIRHMRRTSDPIMRLRHVLAQPYTSLAVGSGLVFGGAVGGYLYVSVFTSAGRLQSPEVATLSVVFLSIGWTIGSNVSSRVLERFDTALIAAASATVSGTLTGVVAWLVLVRAPLWAIFTALAFSGLGIGGASNASLRALRVVTPDSEIGRVISAHEYVRSLGFTLGSAVTGGILLAVVGARVGNLDAVREVLAGGGGEATAATSAAIETGYGVALVAGAGMYAAAAVTYTILYRWLRSQSSVVPR